MDFRGNLEAGGSEDVPEAYTLCGLTITQDGDEPISGIGTGSQETEGEYYGAEIDLLIATGQTKELWTQYSGGSSRTRDILNHPPVRVWNIHKP